MSEYDGSLLNTVSRIAEEGTSQESKTDAFRKALVKKARARGIPIDGTFELTPLCNLDCKMCYVHLNRAKPLDTDTWKSLMSQAIAEGLLTATLTGGECLTHPGFKELYSFLGDHGTETLILSNGVLMDEEMISFLQRRQPVNIQISLYGSSDDAYEKVTGHRVFHTVFSHMLALRDAGLKVTAAVTPSAEMEDAEEILRLLHKNGFRFNLNRMLVPPRTETGRASHRPDYEKMIHLEKVKRELLGLPLYPPVAESDLPPTGGPCSGEKPIISCGAARSAYTVDWHGTMHPCIDFRGISAEPLQTGFHEAWRKIHEQIVDFPAPVECAGCAYSGFCDTCVAHHAMNAPYGHANPVFCELARRAAVAGLVPFSENGKDGSQTQPAP